MTYTPHFKVKPQEIIEASTEALYDKLVISNTITKRSDANKFYLAEGDTLTQKVKGTLPVRTYTARNDRSKPLVADEYKETKVKVTIAQDRPYSLVKITDEQADWDFQDGWGDIIDSQMDTVTGYMEQGNLTNILNAPYEYIQELDNSAAAVKALKDVDQDPYFNAIVDAKLALKKMRTPGDKLFALIGLSLATEIIKSNKLIKEVGNGDSALASDSIGTIAGVQLIASTDIPADQIIMYAQSGFLMFTGTPSVPRGVPFGTTVNANGFALRHILDYDTGFVNNRSLFDAYAGYSTVKDRIAVYNGESQHIVSADEFFVRGLKIGIKGGSLDGQFRSPGDGGDATPGGNPNSYLAKAFLGQHIDTTLPQGTPFPLGGNYPMAKLPATATATAAAGAVTAVAVTDHGAGYQSTPDVTFTGAGTGAEAVAVLSNGQISKVIVTEGGSGYATAPTVTVSAP